MSRVLVSRWARLLLAIGTALLLTVTLPASVRPATGDVNLIVGTVSVSLAGPGVPTGLMDTPRASVKDLQGLHCYTVREVFPNAPEGGYFDSVGNHSSTPVHTFETDACTGPPSDPTALSWGWVRGGHFLSFKTGKDIPLEMPTEFPTTRAPRTPVS